MQFLRYWQDHIYRSATKHFQFDPFFEILNFVFLVTFLKKVFFKFCCPFLLQLVLSERRRPVRPQKYNSCPEMLICWKLGLKEENLKNNHSLIVLQIALALPKLKIFQDFLLYSIVFFFFSSYFPWSRQGRQHCRLSKCPPHNFFVLENLFFKKNFYFWKLKFLWYKFSKFFN